MMSQELREIARQWMTVKWEPNETPHIETAKDICRLLIEEHVAECDAEQRGFDLCKKAAAKLARQDSLKDWTDGCDGTAVGTANNIEFAIGKLTLEGVKQ